MVELDESRRTAGDWDFITPREKIVQSAGRGVRHILEQKHEILKRLEMIFLGGFDDGIYNGTGSGTVRRAAEEPVFPADDKRLDTPLSPVVTDFEPAVKEEAFKICPLRHGVICRQTEKRLWQHPQVLYPREKFVKQRF